MAELKKLPGRPKMKGGKRCRKLDVRFTEEEFGILEGLEKELGLTKTELVRMRVLNDNPHGVVNGRELILRLDAVGTEMGRSGNNINQLAKHANTLNLQGQLGPGVATEFNRLLKGYISGQRLLETALRQIIRLMGK